MPEEAVSSWFGCGTRRGLEEEVPLLALAFLGVSLGIGSVAWRLPFRVAFLGSIVEVGDVVKLLREDLGRSGRKRDLNANWTLWIRQKLYRMLTDL